MTRILIVDDEEMFRYAAEQMLVTLGYDVIAVESGAAALEVVSEQPEVVVHTSRAGKVADLEITGRINPGVEAKDLALAMVGTLGFAGATYQAVEVYGEAIEPMSLDERMTIAVG